MEFIDPNSETDPSILFKERRKWQIALRRYVVNGQRTPFYAPYFGLDVQNFRKWIELQWAEGLNWENFGKSWQLDHIIPVFFFDFRQEKELRLCWSFINIGVNALERDPGRNMLNLPAARAHFEELFTKTGFSVCREMVEKIDSIGSTPVAAIERISDFLKERHPYLEKLKEYGSHELGQLNLGVSPEEVESERQFLLRFG